MARNDEPQATFLEKPIPALWLRPPFLAQPRARVHSTCEVPRARIV